MINYNNNWQLINYNNYEKIYLPIHEYNNKAYIFNAINHDLDILFQSWDIEKSHFSR